MGLIFGMNFCSYHARPLAFREHEPCYHAGQEGNAQVNEHALGDLADGYLDDDSLQPDQRRQHGDEDVGIEAIEQDLKDAVEGHEPGGIFRVALGQIVPYDHHRNATGQADQDQPDEVLGEQRLVGLQYGGRGAP